MVEANPELCAVLEERGLKVINAAVGAEDGRVILNVSSNPEGSSVLPLPAESIYGATLDRSIEVDAISLSSLLKTLPGPVDVLKLDIEGAEVAALNSLGDDELREIGQITCEFHDDPSFQFQMKDAVTGLISRLERIGFTCLQFNRPARTNSLFLGPALELSAAAHHWMRVRYDYWPGLVQTVGRLR
jgi:FkbM family methyltransferase